MFYILGALDTAEFSKAKEVGSPVAAEGAQSPTSVANAEAPDLSPEEKAIIETENKKVHLGRFEADSIALSDLHQDVRDLVNKM